MDTMEANSIEPSGFEERDTMLVNLACWVAVALGANGEALPNLESPLQPGRPVQVEVPGFSAERLLSVSIAVKQPGRLTPRAPITATVGLGQETLTKTLQLGDPDVVWTILQPKDTRAIVTLE